MKKNGKNEELQSRREFFKRAAKGALPILAGAALLSSPILSETANAMSCAGCNNRCMNSCFNTLKSYIYNSVAELRFFRNSSQSLCNRFGRSRKCAPSIESSTIIQWAGSFYSRHVSQQTDSEWQPLYPQHPARFFSRWLGRLHSNRNRRHETSLSAASYVTHCYCHHLYLLQIT